MAIVTEGAHVSRALDFFVKPNIYVGIGKSTPWNDEDTPPTPTSDITELEEIIGYKKVEATYLVIPDETNGTISYRDTKWSVVSQSEAMAKNAKYVYLETSIRYDELPLIAYRQIGLFSGLVPYKGRAHKVTITVSNGATNSGNLTLQVGGTEIEIPVTSGSDTDAVASSIINHGVNGWTLVQGSSTNTIVLTCNTVGEQQTEVAILPHNTGVITSIHVDVAGTEPVSQKFNLLPEEVDDFGILEVVENGGESNRLPNRKE